MECIEKAPLRFVPYLKGVIWGGDKICRYKGIEQPQPNIGESWEISVVPGHESIVAEGKYAGWSIIQLIEHFGAEFIGDKVYSRYKGAFPLLVKFIDANDNLSVQVHPDDKLAKARHNSLGKTEMWYIIESEKGARIFSGLNRSISPEEYEEHIKNDTFTSVLAEHDSTPGDVFFLPAGRVHAIGGGNLLAEIQESSDVTYRIYDYGRKDKEGNTRELHTELAKDAIDFNFHRNYKSPRPADDDLVELVTCEHFSTHRLKIGGSRVMSFDSSSFTIMICIEGEIKIEYPEGEKILRKGQTILFPASLNNVTLKGKGTVLISRS